MGLDLERDRLRGVGSMCARKRECFGRGLARPRVIVGLKEATGGQPQQRGALASIPTELRSSQTRLC